MFFYIFRKKWNRKLKLFVVFYFFNTTKQLKSNLNILYTMAGFHTKTFMKHDDYMTPKSAWENIKQFIPTDKVIYEPFYGDGKSGEYLRQLGFTVIHEPIDFFENDLGDIIVSNPPFSKTKDILKRLKDLDTWVLSRKNKNK